MTGVQTCALPIYPDAGGKDYRQALNPTAKKTVAAFIEPGLSSAKPGEHFQFERHGYFVADLKDHSAAKPVFNMAVSLKDSSGK